MGHPRIARGASADRRTGIHACGLAPTGHDDRMKHLACSAVLFAASCVNARVLSARDTTVQESLDPQPQPLDAILRAAGVESAKR